MYFCKAVKWDDLEKELNAFEEEGFDPLKIELDHESEVVFLVMYKVNEHEPRSFRLSYHRY